MNFFFNNSCLPLLTCSKQYHLRVVRGLKPPPGGNKYLAAGTAFHKMMQLVGTEACPNLQLALLFGDKTKLHKTIQAIPESQALQLAKVGQRIYEEHPELYKDAQREFYFEYQDPNVGPATRCGTIDLITYDAATDTVILTDYKTTAKPIDGSLITNYTLSSQRFFYLLAAYYLDLPEHYIKAIAASRLAWRYCFVSYEKDEYHLATPALVDLTELETFAGLFTEKAYYAAALHEDSTLALKEGILNGACWKCPYTSICTAADETKLIESWPYGTAPYNARHDD